MIKNFFHKFYNKQNIKIFNISSHRTGTTSFGDFFQSFGYKRASYRNSKDNNWAVHWYNSDFDKIFDSVDFQKNQVFEDDPWYFDDFYQVVYWRFPSAKFILVERDEKDWFNSMLNHSQGRTLGNTLIHARLYNREKELNEKYPDYFNHANLSMNPDNLLSLVGQQSHYIPIYNERNEKVRSFFKLNSPENFLTVDLYDPNKWNLISDFIGFKIPRDFNIHSNKS